MNNTVISIKSASYIRKTKLWKRSFIVSLTINVGLIAYIVLTTITA